MVTNEFDAYASSYEDTLSRALAISGENPEYFARGRLSLLKRCLNGCPDVRISSILDFGCGVGSNISLLRQELGAEQIVGIDASAACLETARRRNPTGALFYLPDEFPRRDDIDLAFCNGVFHHIVPASRPGAVQLISESLRPGGMFALWENNPWNPGTRYSMAQCEFDRDAIAISAREAVTMVQAAGFRVLDVRFVFVFPRIMRRLRWSEWYLSRLPLGAQYQVLSQKPVTGASV